MDNMVKLRQIADNLVEIAFIDIDLYFSYETLVAFRAPEMGLIVCKNVWSRTTGKHLNLIAEERHVSRVDRDEFERLKAVLANHAERQGFYIREKREFDQYAVFVEELDPNEKRSTDNGD